MSGRRPLARLQPRRRRAAGKRYARWHCWNVFFSRRGAGAQRLSLKTIHAARDSGPHDFFSEVLLAYRLKQSRPKFPVNRNRCLDHSCADFVFCHPPRLRAPAGIISSHFSSPGPTSAVRRRYPVASTAWLALLGGVHQRLELALEWTEFRGGDIPHDGVVHSKIVVNEAIAHASHLPPFDVWLLRAQFLRDLFRRLANDLQAADESSLQGGVLAESAEVPALELGQDVVNLIKHVPDVLTRRFGHALPPSGYGVRYGGSGSRASPTRPDAPKDLQGRRRGP